MILFFLIISVGNLALGYFVALKYHSVLFPGPVRERELVRPQSDPAPTVPAITIDASQMSSISPVAPQTSEPVQKTKEPVEIELPEAQTEEAVQSEPEPKLEPETAQLEPAEQEEEPVASETAEPEAAAESEPADEPAENEMSASLDEFMSGLMEFRSQLSNLDQRVRKCVKAPDSREIEDCIKEFRIANSLYLEQTNETAERLQQPNEKETETQSEARSAFQQALSSQVEEVRKADQELNEIDLEGNPEAGCETLLRNANSLHASNDRMREEIHSAQREFCPEPEASTEEEKAALLLDELTQIPSRHQLELEMRRQVESGELYCVGLVDIDGCGELNLQHGQRIIDGVIKSLARIVSDASQKEVCAARYSGQQFAILFAGQEPAEAALLVEHIRQRIDNTKFQCEDLSLELTVSVVLVTGTDTDTLTSIEQRLRTAVAAGKSFGKNRSFQFQDGDVEPILPPDLDFEPAICEVQL